MSTASDERDEYLTAITEILTIFDDDPQMTEELLAIAADQHTAESAALVKVREIGRRVMEGRGTATGTPSAASTPPPGRYGRIEIPGYRENEGWVSEETRFGLQVAVVRDREGCETAAIGIGPLCRVVWLPVPGQHPEPVRALTAGAPAWADQDDDEDDDETCRCGDPDCEGTPA